MSDASPRAAAAPTPAPPSAPLASLGDRLIAQVVDGLVAFGVFFVVGTRLAPRFGGVRERGFELTGGPALLVLAIAGAVMLLYFVAAEAWAGATLGKLVAGIQVRTVAGEDIGGAAAIVRNLLRVVDAVGVYLVAAGFVLATRRRQRLGDLLAGTIVVRREAGRGTRLAALAAAVLIAVLGVVLAAIETPA